LGKSLSPFVTVRTSLGVTDVDYSELAAKWLYTEEWRRELESSTTVANSWSIERNTLDFYRDPTTGSKHELTGTIAGLGGDNNFVKIEHDSTWYFPFGEDKKWILSFRAREGWMTEYGSSDFVPLAYRFFAGGTNTVRGYRTRDVGPREPRFWFPGSSAEPIGGNVRLVDNLEMKYKITDVFRVYAFVDSGGIWRDTSDFSVSDIRFGAGLGLGVDVPRLGPIRVDYGYPINPDSRQSSNGRLHMSTGFRF
jgi:outer membrane protein insertion porin family